MHDIDYRFDVREVIFTAIRSSGAGGQNVNKVASAVLAKLPLKRATLPVALKNRLTLLYPNRINNEGELFVKAQEHRTQELNRVAAVARLGDLLFRASRLPKKRIATQVPRGEKLKRLRSKKREAGIKKLRGKVREAID